MDQIHQALVAHGHAATASGRSSALALPAVAKLSKVGGHLYVGPTASIRKHCLPAAAAAAAEEEELADRRLSTPPPTAIIVGTECIECPERDLSESGESRRARAVHAED